MDSNKVWSERMVWAQLVQIRMQNCDNSIEPLSHSKEAHTRA
jgi:hypothetical protein